MSAFIMPRRAHNSNHKCAQELTGGRMTALELSVQRLVMYRCEVPGKVGVKKNQRRLIWRGSRPLSIPSLRYTTWEAIALPHILKARTGTLLCALDAYFEFHFKNKQAEIDIDNCLSGPLDLLQKAGVLKNDKQVVSVVAKKIFGLEDKIIIELRQAI